ncbi:flagellar hook-length control protein FliK [Rhodosalinus sp.]|uniref:flagellar hook-length control protein FliK n=1 Tax=Rhodosalinus sp. TaxID=2047741 RepID=UPI00397D379A
MPEAAAAPQELRVHRTGAVVSADAPPGPPGRTTAIAAGASPGAVKAAAAPGDAPLFEPMLAALDTVGAPASAGQPQASSQPELASQAARIVRQIVEVMPSGPDRMTELTLDPEELGRVRLGIATGEQGVSVQILAERPETLELLRRNLDLLSEDLRRLGFSGITVDLGSGGAGAGAEERSPAPREDAAPAPDATHRPGAPAPERADAPTGRGALDLRL